MSADARWFRQRYRPTGVHDSTRPMYGRHHRATGVWHLLDADLGRPACGTRFRPDAVCEMAEGAPPQTEGEEFRVCPACERLAA